MEFLNPDQAVKEFGLKPGMIVADFGCGAGYFSLALAKEVGSQGRVYAIDIQKEVLEVVRNRAKSKHLSNISTIWADLEIAGSSKLKNELADFVLVASILFQTEDKMAVVREARRILKPKGRAAAIESYGRIAKEETEKLFLSAGFVLNKEIYKVGTDHYLVLFEKA
ncbi:MAG: methyltransferase domain-containing protein [Patescibacteria group bacterium]